MIPFFFLSSQLCIWYTLRLWRETGTKEWLQEEVLWIWTRFTQGRDTYTYIYIYICALSNSAWSMVNPGILKLWTLKVCQSLWISFCSFVLFQSVFSHKQYNRKTDSPGAFLLFCSVSAYHHVIHLFCAGGEKTSLGCVALGGHPDTHTHTLLSLSLSLNFWKFFLFRSLFLSPFDQLETRMEWEGRLSLSLYPVGCFLTFFLPLRVTRTGTVAG